MRARMTALVFCLLITPYAFAAPQAEEGVDRVFRFGHTDAEQAIQEISAIVRSITEIRMVTADPAARTLTLRGTARQIALAEWLLNELDQPGPPGNGGLEKREYRLSVTPDDVVRIFHAAHIDSVQKLTETATLLRAIGDIRWLFTYGARRMIVARGTTDQVRVAEWLLDELVNSNRQTTAKYEYRVRGVPEDAVRVFYLTQAESVQDLTEATTVVRAITDIRRLFAYTASKAVAVRGTAEQASLAEWLFTRLNDRRKPGDAAVHEYRLTNVPDDAVRLFRLADIDSVEELQKIATQVRLTTQVRRIFIHAPSRALTFAGPAIRSLPPSG